MKRYYVIFMGQVQGVGFRYTAEKVAYRYNLSGWVKNRDDGSVDMEIQGDPNTCLKAIREIMNASRWIIVDDYSIKEIPVQNESRFHVNYY